MTVTLLCILFSLLIASAHAECTLCEFEKLVSDLVKSVKNIESNQAKFLERCGVQSKGKDCADLYESGIRSSGVYDIFPADQKGSIKVYCDMVTDGGGWTVFQKRQDGSVDFYRGWNDYKLGFGNLNGEFWLGNDHINRLTNQGGQQLRVDMEDTSGTSVYASYDMFAISAESTNYQLSLGSYSGNAGDSLGYHKGKPFSTKDRDNDSYGDNCALKFKGAWWYGACHNSNLNGLYHHGVHNSYADGVNWEHFKGDYYSLKRTSMKIRPAGFKSKRSN